MTTMRESLWAKILAVLLGLGLAILGGAAGLWTLYMGVEYWNDSDGQYEATNDCYQLYEEYSNLALERFCLEQIGDQLNYPGRQRADELTRKLDAGSTNFRYRILTLDGTYLDGNTGGAMLDDLVRSVEYYTFLYSPEEACYYGYSGIYEGEYYDGYESFWALDYYVAGDMAAADEDTGADASADTAAEETEGTVYLIEYGLTKNLTVEDDFAAGAAELNGGYDQIPKYGILAGGALFLTLILTIWLMTAAGHRAGEEKIHLCALHRIPFDLWLVVEGFASVGACAIGIELFENLFYPYATEYVWPICWGFGLLFGMVNLLILQPTLVTVSARCKAGTLWKSTVLYRLWRLAYRLLSRVRLFWKAAIIVALYLIVFNFFAVNKLWSGWAALFFLLLALAGIAAVLYWCDGWARLRKGGANIAAGNLNDRVNTNRLPPDLKAHAEDLNSISVGMAKAVEEQRKSDLFQAELITNVSHDLKTPLTSIINYVDLLKKLDLEDPTAREYLEVLDRKSQRLKTLTEDLVEASKASAGVLKVTTTRISLSQCVEQAAAEYSERLEGAQLALVTTLPEEEVHVNADGRYLWRIFDNLFSNCVKYAMPGTRIYLDVTVREKKAVLQMKNISREPLNIPAEQLMERFVRGDLSRHTEGSGLGLSIARSLASLQGADFQLEVDGDLFKVCLTFPNAD